MGKRQGDSKGRLYYDDGKTQTFIVEATLAVALLSTVAIIHRPLIVESYGTVIATIKDK